MFPKENHALTRTGNMKAQERHLQEIVSWFVRYLQGKEEATDETQSHDGRLL
jgi:dipeptidyl aminopeptidase/acylaminoacyl peptidase